MLLQKGSDLILGFTYMSIVFKVETIILLFPVLVLPQWKSGVQFEQFKKGTNQPDKVWKSIRSNTQGMVKKTHVWFGLEKRKVKAFQ